MQSIIAIAGIVFRENLRKRIIPVFLLLELIILIWASTYRVFSLGVQVKFLKDLALFSLSFIGILITITCTAGQLSNELENRTIYPLLSKPISRGRMLLGKYFGALFIILINVLILGSIFMVLLYFHEHLIDRAILQAIYLLGLECAVMAAICLFFSTFFSTAANVTITFLIYLLGHLKSSYGEYILHEFPVPVLKWIVQMVNNPIFPPNLENFNIQEAIVENLQIPLAHILYVTGYGIVLILLYLGCARFLFSRRDL